MCNSDISDTLSGVEHELSLETGKYPQTLFRHGGQARAEGAVLKEVPNATIAASLVQECADKAQLTSRKPKIL